VAKLEALKERDPVFQKGELSYALTAKADDDGDNRVFTLEETGDNPSSLKKFEFTNDSNEKEKYSCGSHPQR